MTTSENGIETAHGIFNIIRNADEWIYCLNNNDGIVSSWDRNEQNHLIKSDNFEQYILDEMVDAKEEWD